MINEAVFMRALTTEVNAAIERRIAPLKEGAIRLSMPDLPPSRPPDIVMYPTMDPTPVAAAVRAAGEQQTTAVRDLATTVIEAMRLSIPKQTPPTDLTALVAILTRLVESNERNAELLAEVLQRPPTKPGKRTVTLHHDKDGKCTGGELS